MKNLIGILTVICIAVSQFILLKASENDTPSLLITGFLLFGIPSITLMIIMIKKEKQGKS